VSIEILDERVPMRDGVLLATDVILDADAGPRPVMLFRTPYSRAEARLVHDVVGLARGGWAVVVQDVRGRFDSGGTFTPFEQEVDDGFDAIDWCATQPWSDGRVVMSGWSYLGAAQWYAALSGHPALKAINPIVGAGDIGETMLWEGGAFQVGLVQPWVLGLASSDPTASQELRERAGDIGGRWWEALRAAPADDPAVPLSVPYAAWRRGQFSVRDVSQVQVPAFQIAGWYDIFLESSLRHWSACGGVLVIGPWSHSNQLSNLHADYDFGAAGSGAYGGVLEQAIDWMRGVADGQKVESEIRCFVMGEGWRVLTCWPPPSEPMVLRLGDGGVLSARAGSGFEVLDHDPTDPVPTRGGRVLGPFLPMPGPVDQRSVEERPDVLVWTSAPLEDDVVVIGLVTARIRVESNGRSVDVAVKLCDVHPDERSINIVDSIRRLDVVPGQPVDADVAVGSTAWRFPQGHRIRVEVAGSNFPRFDVNPSTGEPPGTARHLLPAVHRIHCASSAITLPTV